ncbi:hypothetical protein B0T25DRAFT_425718, partial [Lasiosphaeria hispida]
MCYYEQTRWGCGYWRWGNFRQQCNKEYRTGETCGLKLVYDTIFMSGGCKICDRIAKTEKSVRRIVKDIERWKREGNRRATIQHSTVDLIDLNDQIASLRDDHD